MKKIILAIVVLLLAGCSASGPKVNISSIDPVTESESRIFLMRESSFYGIADVPDITINGIETADLLNGAAIQLDVSPGRHMLTASGWGRPGSSTLKFTIDSGQTAYVIVAPNTGYITSAAIGGMIGASMAASGDNTGPYRFLLVDQQQGLNTLQGLELTNQSQTNSTLVSPSNHKAQAKEQDYTAPLSQQTTPDKDTSSGESLDQRLRALHKLYKDGVITQAEFDAKKSELLSKY